MQYLVDYVYYTVHSIVNERGLSISSVLSASANVGLANMYKKGTVPTFNLMLNICSSLNITFIELRTRPINKKEFEKMTGREGNQELIQEFREKHFNI